MSKIYSDYLDQASTARMQIERLSSGDGVNSVDAKRRKISPFYQLMVTLPEDLPRVSRTHVTDNFRDHISVSVNGTPVELQKIVPHESEQLSNTVSFRFSMDDEHQPIDVTLFGASILSMMPSLEHRGDKVTQKHLLTSTYTRLMSKRGFAIPPPTSALEAADTNAEPYRVMRTDLHTHLTGQISAQDLVSIAKERDLAYPCELLQHIGIDASPYQKTMIQSIYFHPKAKEGLVCEQGKQTVEAVSIQQLLEQDTAKLARSMHLPTFQRSTFDDMEEVYRMRNPLLKNPTIITDMIMAIAKDYKKQGVEYAELSATSVFTPAWLKQALPALEKAEKDYGVKLRVLAGVPRDIAHKPMQQKIQQLKVLLNHPYIVGIDFLGYEHNKTAYFAWLLKDLMKWSDSLDYDIVVRVHACETQKHHKNSQAVLDAAQGHPHIITRLGHDVHRGDESDDESNAASSQDEISEFNLASNVALSTVTGPEELPLDRQRFVAGTDGGGVYLTDAQSTIQDMAMTGQLTPEKLTIWQETEAAYIEKATKNEKVKNTEFHARYTSLDDFISSLSSSIESITHSSNMGPKGKIPMYISGDVQTDMVQKRRIEKVLEQLVNTLDPELYYFVVGRMKPGNIVDLLDKTLSKSKHAFHVTGLLIKPDSHSQFPTNMDSMVELRGDLNQLPGTVSKALLDEKAILLVFDGKVNTQQMVQYYANRGGTCFISDIPSPVSEQLGYLPEEAGFCITKPEELLEKIKSETHIRLVKAELKIHNKNAA